MRGQWLRAIAGLVVFAGAAAVGALLLGRFDTAADPDTFINQVTADSWALILAIAMILSAITFFILEYLQTGRLASVSGQFTTRTFVLMPVAIAINIALGTALAYALKIPIYMDSIGTILVGVLCGPIAGALTGALGNVLWSYVIPPPFQYPPGAAFAVAAVAIGLIAGVAGRLGILRPRPNRSLPQLAVGGAVAIGLIAIMAWLAYLGYRKILGDANLTPQSDNAVFVVLGWLALALIAVAILGLVALLAIRRDLTAAYVVVCGVITGIIAALISAPIAAGVFGGVTASGTDFLVAAFRQAGADLQAATLGQGLISDPIDKVITFFVVYVIIAAMARRTRRDSHRGSDSWRPREWRPSPDRIRPGDGGSASGRSSGGTMTEPPGPGQALRREAAGEPSIPAAVPPSSATPARKPAPSAIPLLPPPPTASQPPPFVGRTGSTPWHRLNPLTKLVAAVLTGVAALVAGGLVVPLLIVVLGVLLPGAVAQLLPRLLRTVVVLTLPLAISVLLVNLLFFPGGQDVLFRLGPITATVEGLVYGLEVLVRLLALSGGVTLFYLTTQPGDLTQDLERRGVPPRVAFVANSSIQMVPGILERAAAITSAQRARGLDTEGNILARARGIIPIVGPVILGSIADVEERTLALEARAFGRPGRRTLLWEPPDSGRQRVARWAMVAVIPALVVARAAGALP